MKRKRRSFEISLRHYLLLIVFCSTALLQQPVYADMMDYCITPPFIVSGVYPNLLLMLDNSGSMYDPAYIAGSTGTAPAYYCNGGTTATTTSYCLDNTYSNSATQSYEGYFDQDAVYSYNGSEFVAAATIPAPCTYSTSYMCVNITSGAVDKFVATGKFLNWLSASKFDVEKKILTGGKFLDGTCSATTTTSCSGDGGCPSGETCTGYLQSETRGCVGRRFIKEIPAADFTSPDHGITFAVRGPNPLDPDFAVNNFVTDVRGGGTKIEIYQTAFDNQDCQCAVYNWTSGNYGQASTDTKGCLDVTGMGNTTSGRELSTFNHSLQVCWQIQKNIQDAVDAGVALDHITDGDIFPNSLNYQDLLVACTNAYDGDYGDDPTQIKDKNSGNYICTAYDATSNPDATHLDTHGVKPYDVDGPDTTGFIGKCWMNNSDSWPPPTATTSTSTAVKCIHAELLHYCMGQAYGEVIDPSEGASETDSTGNIPAVIMDAGVRALGDPLTFSGGTDAFFNAKVAVSSAPKGLVQEYAARIRIGAMSFNYNGSASECGVSGSGISCPMRCSVTTTKICSTNVECPSGETCNKVTNLDGAQIISYIGDSLGDHGTGMVKQIDDLSGSSWTPFAEAFYEAIGYYAKNPDETYTIPPTQGTSRNFRLFSHSPAVEQTGDYALDKNPSLFKCQKNNILLITDGTSTGDQNSKVADVVSHYNYTGVSGSDDEIGSNSTCPKYEGSMDVDDMAYLAKNWNIRTFDPAGGSEKGSTLAGSQYITTYVVYSGPQTSTETGQCNPMTLMDDTAKAGGTDSAYTASDPSQLKSAITNALNKIAIGSASGTAASVLASGEGSGANLVQAVFYPSRKLDQDIAWTGVMENLWYYIDPMLNNSTIREDTDSNKILGLTHDNIVNFFFDSGKRQTDVNLYADANGDSVKDDPDTPTDTVSLDGLKFLWEAGRTLWNTPASSRNIYTDCSIDSMGTACLLDSGGNSRGLMYFTTANEATIAPYLNTTGDAEAKSVIRYTRGEDTPFSPAITGFSGTYRNRTVKYDLNGDGDFDDTVSLNGASVSEGTPQVWKLGDIIDSTPKIVSWVPLNLYDKTYQDDTYRQFINSAEYKARDMVFTGGNDGMLHAFKMGILGLYSSGLEKATLGKYCTKSCTVDSDCVSPQTCDATAHCSANANTTCTVNSDCSGGETCTTDSDMGEEKWAFIPKDSLPYLKYLADPDYCHLYYLDASPYVFDASIKRDTDASQPASCIEGVNAVDPTQGYWNCKKTVNSWRTIVIVGMRLGGASKTTSSDCPDCVKTPIANTGYSSYSAIDITDQANPKLLWEFTDPGLGYSTTGPSVIRVGDRDKNGRWFVVFGSGPTGNISANTRQFTGIAAKYDSSSGSYLDHKENMKLFVVDLKTGDAVRTIDTGVLGGFVGSLNNSTIDFNGDYEDDAMYFGYTYMPTHSTAELKDARGGAVDSIRLASDASTTDDAYKGEFIEMVKSDGTNLNYHGAKLIVSYNGTTQTAKVNSAWGVVPDSSTTQYLISDGWNYGGVMRLLTKDSTSPADWALSTVMAGIGPVTSSITRLQNYVDQTVRLYFGTGRYYYRINDLLDDANALRRVYGVKEPCFPDAAETSPYPNIDFTCTQTVAEGDLTEAATGSGTTDSDGWYIKLDNCTDSDGTELASCTDPNAVYKTERMVTDPVASPNGVVFFTTVKPTADPCEYGGNTHLWAVQYNTGGTVPEGTLKGKAIMQLSTGEIKEVDLRSAFTQRDDRRTGGSPGMAPTGPALSLIVPPKPTERILHIKKK